jgi:hypothetical protein
MPYLRFPFLMIFLWALFALGCRAPLIKSNWAAVPIKIDGNDTDWAQRFYIEGAPVDLGAANDANYFYLTVSTTDRLTQMKILRTGFIVFFDPGGGKEKTQGLHFPLGMMQQEPQTREDANGGFGGPGLGRRGNQAGPGQDSPSFNPAQLEAAIDKLLLETELEIIDATGRSRRLSLDQLGDMRLAMDYSHGRLIYELRVPLGEDGVSPLALALKQGKKLGVGFATPTIDRDRIRQEAGRKGAGGRPGGFGGGRSGGGGRRGGSRPSFEQFEPFELWTRIQMARPTAP